MHARRDITPLSMFLCLWRPAGGLPEKPVQTPQERQGRGGREGKGKSQCCKETDRGRSRTSQVGWSVSRTLAWREGCLTQLPGACRWLDSLLLLHSTYIIFPALRFKALRHAAFPHLPPSPLTPGRNDRGEILKYNFDPPLNLTTIATSTNKTGKDVI